MQVLASIDATDKVKKILIMKYFYFLIKGLRNIRNKYSMWKIKHTERPPTQPPSCHSIFYALLILSLYALSGRLKKVSKGEKFHRKIDGNLSMTFYICRLAHKVRSQDFHLLPSTKYKVYNFDKLYIQYHSSCADLFTLPL